MPSEVRSAELAAEAADVGMNSFNAQHVHADKDMPPAIACDYTRKAAISDRTTWHFVATNPNGRPKYGP